MAIDFYMNGLRARKHQASGTKITEDGKYVEKEYMENGVLKKFNPIIEICKNGLRRILNKKLGFLYIQDLVMECFGSPKPADGQDWVIAHLDGNMQNDHYKNLGWKLRKDAYPHIPAKTDKQVKLANGIVVRQDGRIYQKGKKLPVGKEIYDRDTDLRIPTEPFVRYEWKNRWKKTETTRIDVEDAMAAAGYVDGNKLQFKNPVILHKDDDYMNCSSSNLEWCEKTDERYIEYYNKTVDTHNALGHDYNSNWPNFMDSKKL